MLQNILQQPAHTTTSTSTKLNFLQSQKQQLSELIDQLNTSLRINKQTISKMAILTNESLTFQSKQTTFNQIILDLNFENRTLRDRNQKLMEEIGARECKLLIQNQVREEAEAEFVGILKQYEDKILELRRSLQDKEFLLQEREAVGMEGRKIGGSSNYAEPKQEIMKLHSENSEMKELMKRVIEENGVLREENEKLKKKDVENQFKVGKLEGLMQSQMAYSTAKQLFNSQNKQKRSSSAGKISFPPPFLSTTSTLQQNQLQLNSQQSSLKPQLKNPLYSSTIDSYSARNETITSLRKIIFKLRQSQSILKTQLQTLQHQTLQLTQTNKLLRQSNIQHQVDRHKQQSEINFLKYKNHQLASIITKRRADERRSGSVERDKVDVIVKEGKGEIVPVQDRKEVQYYFNISKYELGNNMAVIDSNISRVHFGDEKRGRGKGMRRCFSSTVDYVPKSEVDGVEKYLNKKIMKNRQEESKVDQFPFSIDYSVIENKNSSPLTFADFRNKAKNKKFTESFMMITEEILKM